MSVLTEQTNITSRQRPLTIPGRVYHHRNVASDARISSMYIPPAPTAARRQRLGIIQESVTLQYRQGVKTSSISPISWHSPPNRLQARPWPISCRILVTQSVSASQSQFFAAKNSRKSGRRERKTSNSAPMSKRAENMSSSAAASAGSENSQPKYRLSQVSRRSGS